MAILEGYYDKLTIEAGCDEAGRGCLAGPVFASAVILPKDFRHHLLNDSKQVSEKNRRLLRSVIEREAVSWAVASVSAEEIDNINILNASIEAIHRAIAKLTSKPELLLIDGNRFAPYADIAHLCIIKGDSKYASIAAASILAKTHRDEYMTLLSNEFPQYGWSRNMAYPTQEHKKAIQEFGLTPYHRKSFKFKSDI